jgi:enoyl-CoA hydratase
MENIILWEVADNVGKIILNSLPSNSMTELFFERLKHIVDKDIPSSNVSAIIISGAGRHYSSGADINDLLRIIRDNITLDFNGKVKEYPKLILENIDIFNKINELNIPVISAIKGICLGSGLELALFSHIRICCDGAILGLPEVSYELMPGCGGIVKMIELAGIPKTVELVLDGNFFTGDEALEFNVVDKVLPKKAFMENVVEFTKRISINYDKKNIKDYIKLL